MARRNDPNDDASIKKKRAQEQEQEQEQESEREREKKSGEKEGLREQNQYGNQTIASMLGLGGGSPGGAGMAMEPSIRGAAQDQEKESEIQFGGDDDAADDGPITIDDLTRSWNPGTKKSDDKLRFIESMPYDNLPGEDPVFIQALHRWSNKLPIPTVWSVDGLIEPSAAVIAASLSKWNASVSHWIRPSLENRCAAYMISPSAPFLQDDHGRLIHSRARCAAVGTWLLLDSELLCGKNLIANAAFLNFSMELDGRDFVVQRVLKSVEDSENRIPRATDILNQHLSERTGLVQPTALEQAPVQALIRSLNHILAFQDPTLLIPPLTARGMEAEPDDDPLGIDQIIQMHTKEQKDISARLYNSGLASAEKLAKMATETRVRLASACILVADVSAHWSRGTPAKTLFGIAGSVDKRCDGTLRMLVEIAQAAKNKSVAIDGIANGLARAAREILTLRRQIMMMFTELVGGILPALPSFKDVQPHQDDWLSAAFRDGRPQDALEELDELSPSRSIELAKSFILACAGSSPSDLLPHFQRHLQEADESTPVPMQEILHLCAGVCHLRCGNLEEALSFGHAQIQTGRKRKNGILIAQGTLIASEALHFMGQQNALHELRHTMGRLCWDMGCRGALTLIARWSPEDENSADA